MLDCFCSWYLSVYPSNLRFGLFPDNLPKQSEILGETAVANDLPSSDESIHNSLETAKLADGSVVGSHSLEMGDENLSPETAARTPEPRLEDKPGSDSELTPEFKTPLSKHFIDADDSSSRTPTPTLDAPTPTMEVRTASDDESGTDYFESAVGPVASDSPSSMPGGQNKELELMDLSMESGDDGLPPSWSTEAESVDQLLAKGAPPLAQAEEFDDSGTSDSAPLAGLSPVLQLPKSTSASVITSYASELAQFADADESTISSRGRKYVPQVPKSAQLSTSCLVSTAQPASETNADELADLFSGMAITDKRQELMEPKAKLRRVEASPVVDLENDSESKDKIDQDAEALSRLSSVCEDKKCEPVDETDAMSKSASGETSDMKIESEALSTESIDSVIPFERAEPIGDVAQLDDQSKAADTFEIDEQSSGVQSKAAQSDADQSKAVEIVEVDVAQSEGDSSNAIVTEVPDDPLIGDVTQSDQVEIVEVLTTGDALDEKTDSAEIAPPDDVAQSCAVTCEAVETPNNRVEVDDSNSVALNLIEAQLFEKPVSEDSADVSASETVAEISDSAVATEVAGQFFEQIVASANHEFDSTSNPFLDSSNPFLDSADMMSFSTSTFESDDSFTRSTSLLSGSAVPDSLCEDTAQPVLDVEAPEDVAQFPVPVESTASRVPLPNTIKDECLPPKDERPPAAKIAQSEPSEGDSATAPSLVVVDDMTSRDLAQSPIAMDEFDPEGATSSPLAVKDESLSLGSVAQSSVSGRGDSSELEVSKSSPISVPGDSPVRTRSIVVKCRPPLHEATAPSASFSVAPSAPHLTQDVTGERYFGKVSPVDLLTFIDKSSGPSCADSRAPEVVAQLPVSDSRALEAVAQSSALDSRAPEAVAQSLALDSRASKPVAQFPALDSHTPDAQSPAPSSVGADALQDIQWIDDKAETAPPASEKFVPPPEDDSESLSSGDAEVARTMGYACHDNSYEGALVSPINWQQPPRIAINGVPRSEAALDMTNRAAAQTPDRDDASSVYFDSYAEPRTAQFSDDDLQPKSLDSLASDEAQSGGDEADEGAELYVVSYVNTPGNFYVQRVADAEALRSMEAKLREFADAEIAPNEVRPEAGHVYGGEIDERLYRVRVLDTSSADAGFAVCCVDYGRVGKVRRLFELPASVQSATALAIACSIPLPYYLRTWPVDVCHEFERMVTTKQRRFQLRRRGVDADAVVVDLTRGSVSVAQRMKTLCEEFNEGDAPEDAQGEFDIR